MITAAPEPEKAPLKMKRKEVRWMNKQLSRGGKKTSYHLSKEEAKAAIMVKLGYKPPTDGNKAN